MVHPFIFWGGIVLGKWILFRNVQHGGDHNATAEKLLEDLANAATIGANATTIGKDMTVALAKYVVQLKIRNTTSLQSIGNAARDIRRAVEHLPEETRNGLNETINLDKRIDGLIRDSVILAGRELALQRGGDEKTREDVLRRYYLGLFLLGVCEKQLDEDEVRGMTLSLAAEHAFLDRGDHDLIEVLRRFESANAEQLVKKLCLVPEVYKLATGKIPVENIAPYIARALANIETTSHQNLSTEIIDRFAAKL